MSASGSDSSSIKIVHHEKDNCCIILWHIEHFTTCAETDCASSPPFSVNSRSSIKWCLYMSFKSETTKKEEEPDFYGIALRPLIVPKDLSITCRFTIVENNGQLYSAEPCVRKVSKVTGKIVFQKLIGKEFLSLNGSRFLNDNTLLICCELNVESKEVPPEVFTLADDHEKFRDENFIHNIMNNLYEMRKHRDLTWSSRENIEQVHKSVLAARSPAFLKEFTDRIDSQPDIQTLGIDHDVVLALLAYIYTGNPYNIKCIPLGLREEARRLGLPLLEYFAEPHIITLRSRNQIQEFNLVLNLKNFYKETHQKKNAVFCEFEIFEIYSKWSLLVDFQEESGLNFTLTSIVSGKIILTIELSIYVLNTRNQFVFLNKQAFLSFPWIRETYSFVTSTDCLQSGCEDLTTGSNLKLKIRIKLSYDCAQDYCEEYETKFSSEIRDSEQKNPPDFERLKADVLKMYDLEIFPDLILKSADGGHVFVHRIIAEFHSPFITALLEEPGLQECDLHLIRQSTLEEVARFMYSGKLSNIDFDEATALLHAAKHYDLIHLSRKVVDVLRRNLNSGTACLIYGIASNFDEEELKAEAHELACPPEPDEAEESGELGASWKQNILLQSDDPPVLCFGPPNVQLPDLMEDQGIVLDHDIMEDQGIMVDNDIMEDQGLMENNDIMVDNDIMEDHDIMVDEDIMEDDDIMLDDDIMEDSFNLRSRHRESLRNLPSKMKPRDSKKKRRSSKTLSSERRSRSTEKNVDLPESKRDDLQYLHTLSSQQNPSSDEDFSSNPRHEKIKSSKGSCSQLKKEFRLRFKIRGNEAIIQTTERHLNRSPRLSVIDVDAISSSRASTTNLSTYRSKRVLSPSEENKGQIVSPRPSKVPQNPVSSPRLRMDDTGPASSPRPSPVPQNPVSSHRLRMNDTGPALSPRPTVEDEPIVSPLPSPVHRNLVANHRLRPFVSPRSSPAHRNRVANHRLRTDTSATCNRQPSIDDECPPASPGPSSVHQALAETPSQTTDNTSPELNPRTSPKDKGNEECPSASPGPSSVHQALSETPPQTTDNTSPELSPGTSPKDKGNDDLPQEESP